MRKTEEPKPNRTASKEEGELHSTSVNKTRTRMVLFCSVLLIGLLSCVTTLIQIKLHWNEATHKECQILVNLNFMLLRNVITAHRFDDTSEPDTMESKQNSDERPLGTWHSDSGRMTNNQSHWWTTIWLITNRRSASEYLSSNWMNFIHNIDVVHGIEGTEDHLSE